MIIITILYDPITGKDRGRSGRFDPPMPTTTDEEYEAMWNAADYANCRREWRTRGRFPVPAIIR